MRSPRWRLMLGVLFAMAIAACSEQEGLTTPESPHFAHNAVGDADFGTTPGWMKGETVTFFYHKNFFCKEAPTSAAASDCEIGAEPEVFPRGGKKNIPVLYVMTPLGFEPDNLQCPVAGDCINHPSTIDASRVFGAGAEEIPLPPHSHIVDEVQGNWWEIEVIGVTDPAVWAEIEEAKSLDRVRELQELGVGITGDIPSNLFLFFNVRK